jgi:hypothetical protein
MQLRAAKGSVDQHACCEDAGRKICREALGEAAVAHEKR